MKFSHFQNVRERSSATTSTAVDVVAYAEVRRGRVDTCRDYRARYLAERAVSHHAPGRERTGVVARSRRAAIAGATMFVALVTVSAVFYSAYLFRGDVGWARLSYWVAGFSILAGLTAVAGSAAHWFVSPRGSAARRASGTLALGSLVVLALVGAGWLARDGSAAEPGVAALLLGIMAAGVAIVTGGVTGDLLGGTTTHDTAAPAERRRRVSSAADERPDNVAAHA